MVLIVSDAMGELLVVCSSSANDVCLTEKVLLCKTIKKYCMRTSNVLRMYENDGNECAAYLAYACMPCFFITPKHCPAPYKSFMTNLLTHLENMLGLAGGH